MAARARLFFLSGAWHGSWCWTRHVTPLLSQLRYECIPIEYPRTMHPKQPARFQDYVTFTVEQIEREHAKDSTKPNVVIAHSFGGIIGSNAVETVMKDKGIEIHGIIHVCSTALCNGQNALDDCVEHELFNKSKWTDSCQSIHDGKWNQLRSECVTDLLYHDCKENDIEFAEHKLVPEIELSREWQANWSAEYYGKVRKLYVECTNDRLLPIALQREYCNALGLKKQRYEVLTLHTSHSPFFSKPLGLTAHLDEWMITKITSTPQKKAY